jgi:hypothetical protein
MRVRTALALATTPLVVAGVAASSNAATATAKATSTTTFIEKTTHSTVLDLNHSGSIGDQYVFTGNLYAGGKPSVQVGHDYGSCTQLNPRISQCQVTIRYYRHSQITVQGVISPTGNGTLAVTGGTGSFLGNGEFRNATGEVTRVAGTGNTAKLIFHIDYPVVS